MFDSWCTDEANALDEIAVYGFVTASPNEDVVQLSVQHQPHSLPHPDDWWIVTHSHMPPGAIDDGCAHVTAEIPGPICVIGPPGSADNPYTVDTESDTSCPGADESDECDECDESDESDDSDVLAADPGEKYDSEYFPSERRVNRPRVDGETR